jgi:uncharacterized membrane protein YdbT with pleckstrin-like domain
MPLSDGNWRFGLLLIQHRGDPTMSYMDNMLLPDEHILYRTKKHAIIFLSPILWTIITGFFFLNANSLIVDVAFLPGIIAILSWLNEGLTYITSEFAVTNKRVLMKEGFFFRHSNETRLTTVANVTVNQSLLAQILNYGTVFINTFGGDNDPFSQIQSPLLFKKAVQTQLDQMTKNSTP